MTNFDCKCDFEVWFLFVRESYHVHVCKKTTTHLRDICFAVNHFRNLNANFESSKFKNLSYVGISWSRRWSCRWEIRKTFCWRLREGHISLWCDECDIFLQVLKVIGHDSRCNAKNIRSVCGESQRWPLDQHGQEPIEWAELAYQDILHERDLESQYVF